MNERGQPSGELAYKTSQRSARLWSLFVPFLARRPIAFFFDKTFFPLFPLLFLNFNQRTKMFIKNTFTVALVVAPAVILAAPLRLPVQNLDKSVDVNVVSTLDPVYALETTSTSISDGSEGIADGQAHRHRRDLREIGQRAADHLVKYANEYLRKQIDKDPSILYYSHNS
ncbi:hypothetical protein FRC18_001603 [Serendipita sp. 400]|nr:hypothetical protein FRC18_001603 [Serendipita sp. 400]